MKSIISTTLILLFFTACSSLNMANVDKQTIPQKQKLISQANKGNIKAMIKLNEYYQYPETKEGFDYYDKWYDTVLKSKNNKDIIQFSDIYSKYSDMFINGQDKYLALLEVASDNGNKEAMLKLIANYSSRYQTDNLQRIQNLYLKDASSENIIELYDYYITSYKTKHAKNLLKTLKETKLIDKDTERILNFKQYIHEKNRAKIEELAPQILQSNNEKIILNCANFLNKRYIIKEAIKFYEKAIELGNDDINTYLAFIKLYKREVDSKDKEGLNKLIKIAEKAALKDNYEATYTLFNLYSKYSEYTKNYTTIKNKILELNESKRALADYYYNNSKRGKAGELLDELANNGNKEAIITLATRKSYSYRNDVEQNKLIDKWKKYILNSNDPKLLTLYNKKTANRSSDKEIKEIDTNNIITLRALYKKNRYKDENLAKKYLEKAASFGDVYSIYNLAKYYARSSKKEDKDKALEIYKILVEKGDISATRHLADIYFQEARDKKDIKKMEKGLKYLEKASTLGDNYSTKKLARFYLCGECKESGFDLVDYKKAKFYLERLEELGDKSAIFSLGWIYDNGHGVKKNKEKAEEYYIKAAKAGYPLGYYNAAYIYYKGENKDYKKALAYLKMGEKENQDECINLLGIFYENGYGVKKDINKAVSYYKRASKYNGYASFNLGKYYRIEKNYDEALKYLKLGIRQGNSNATNELGFMYEKGLGVKKDINKALEYYQTAYIESKNETAAYNIGLVYHYGKGNIKKDLKLAKKWYELSNIKKAKEQLEKLK